jgi:hypothetical protein
MRTSSFCITLFTSFSTFSPTKAWSALSFFFSCSDSQAARCSRFAVLASFASASRLAVLAAFGASSR